MKTAARLRTTHEENVLHFFENVERARRAFRLADGAARIAADNARAARRALKEAEHMLLETQAGR